jgi:hypothetical protein
MPRPKPLMKATMLVVMRRAEADSDIAGIVGGGGSRGWWWWWVGG